VVEEDAWGYNEEGEGGVKFVDIVALVFTSTLFRTFLLALRARSPFI
jgi:hypothetical protein